MLTGKKIKVFYDSSVIIAGPASSRGASCITLSLAEMGVIELYIAEQVVSEVINNVERKLPSCLPQFFTLFKTLPFRLVDAKRDHLNRALELINEKDAPLLAVAMSAGVDVLLNLDKHFLHDELREQLDFVVCTPGDFLTHFPDTPPGNGVSASGHEFRNSSPTFSA